MLSAGCPLSSSASYLSLFMLLLHFHWVMTSWLLFFVFFFFLFFCVSFTVGLGSSFKIDKFSSLWSYLTMSSFIHHFFSLISLYPLRLFKNSAAFFAPSGSHEEIWFLPKNVIFAPNVPFGGKGAQKAILTRFYFRL